jgi:hypothetical protein
MEQKQSNSWLQYTEWFKVLVQYWRILLGRLFVAENIYNFFRFAIVFVSQRIYVEVTLYYCDYLKESESAESARKYRGTDSVSGSGNKSDKSPPHDQKSTQKE